MTPICKMFAAIMEDKKLKIQKLLKAVGVTLKKEEDELVGKPLLKCVMQKWLPVGDAILEMISSSYPRQQRRSAIASRTCTMGRSTTHVPTQSVLVTRPMVRIMGPNYIPGKKSDLWVKNIQRTLIMMG